MIGRKKKKNKNVLNNIQQLKGRGKKERGREERQEGNKQSSCPNNLQYSPGRMTKENAIWGSHEKFKGVFKNNNFNSRNHSYRLAGQVK